MTDFDDEEAVQRGGPKAFIDRREQPTRAGLVVPDVRGQLSQHSIEARKAEFEGLAEAIRLDVLFSEVVKVREIKPATFVGGGHTETFAKRVKDEKIELLLVDAALTAIQQRNLETETGAIRVVTVGIATGQTIIKPDGRSYPPGAWDNLPSQTIAVRVDAEAVLRFYRETLVGNGKGGR